MWFVTSSPEGDLDTLLFSRCDTFSINPWCRHPISDGKPMTATQAAVPLRIFTPEYVILDDFNFTRGTLYPG
jgi:hypothetical protein